MGQRPKKQARFTREKIQSHLSALSKSYLFFGLVLLFVGLVGLVFSLHPISISSKDPSMHWTSASHRSAWSYFHPSWDDSHFHPSRTDSSPLPDSNSKEHVRSLLRSANHVLDPSFTTFPEIASPVSFWISVYAKYDSRIRIVHDRDNLNLVYGYLDFRPLYDRFASDVILRKSIRKIESQVIAQLKVLLRSVEREALALSPHSAELDSLRKLVVNSTPLKNIKSLTMNIRTQSGQKDKFHLAILRSQRFLPEMEKTFAKYKLPKELSRIPFVESSFNVDATSRAGAIGLWQLMPATAAELIGEDKKNLWRHPIIQTRAAARMFRRYRKVLPDLPTAITAYNSGVGRLGKLITRHRARNFPSLFRKLKESELGFAGRNFYPAVVAAIIVEKNKSHLFELEKVPPVYTRVLGYSSLLEADLCLRTD